MGANAPQKTKKKSPPWREASGGAQLGAPHSRAQLLYPNREEEPPCLPLAWFPTLPTQDRFFGVFAVCGVKKVFDATHSVQRPGGAGQQSGGDRRAIAPLARAAVAVGIDALFMEVHPDPERALSDPATQYPLHEVEPLLRTLLELHAVASR